MNEVVDGIIIAFAAASFRNYFAARKDVQQKEEAFRAWQAALGKRLDDIYDILKEHVAREIMSHYKMD